MKPPLILNVDDTEAARYVKPRQLQRAGFTVIEADTGEGALEKVQSEQPSVVVLDVKLPGISGIEVCGRIKRDTPGIMVLQTSAAFTSGADRTRGLDSGADAYLVQPSEAEELVAMVRALLRTQAAEAGLRRLNDDLERRVDERTRELATANERLRREIDQRHKAEAALVQAQKMEAIGQLTGGIAHDFNNLLTAVVGNLDLIRNGAVDQRTLRLATNALHAAERGSKLTAQLLAFSRTQKLATEPVDVAAVLVGLTELLRQSLGPAIRISVEPAACLPAASADANQLELSLLNLAINARDAMPDGGELTVRTKLHKAQEPVGLLPAGEFICVEVADSGVGMSPEVQARAFDPFFTTKPVGKGTGLGLAQVYGMAIQAGGSAEIESAEGRGTTVRIFLPLSAQPVAGSATRSEDSPSSSAKGRVLVVDDDADVRSLMADILSAAGYEVGTAGDGAAGLVQLEDFSPDLVVVDFAMPVVDGAEMARQALAARPNLPILFVSGYADSHALDQAVAEAPFLRKPFRPMELVSAVKDLLAEASREERAP